MAVSAIAPANWPVRSLPSRHARAWRLAPLTAQELLAAVASLPGTRAVPAGGDGIAESRIVGGVEIALAAPKPDDRELRKRWRSRFGGGPTPLLLLTDNDPSDNTVRALGPARDDGPIRVVSANDLLRVVERLPALDSLHAARLLAEELDRLDRTGTSGLQVRGLGTQHLFSDRLRRDARWTDLKARSRVLPGEWKALFERLGYEVEQLSKPLRRNARSTIRRPSPSSWRSSCFSSAFRS